MENLLNFLTYIIQSKLLTELLSRFLSRNNFFAISEVQVSRHFFVIFGNFGLEIFPKFPKVVKHNNFYSCSIPWKTNPPDLSNNRVAVENRQRKTNSFDYLSKKGTSISEIGAVFEDHIKKGCDIYT